MRSPQHLKQPVKVGRGRGSEPISSSEPGVKGPWGARQEPPRSSCWVRGCAPEGGAEAAVVENSFSSSSLVGKHLCDKSIIRCEVRCLKYHKMQTRYKVEYLSRQKLIRVIKDPLGFLFIACMFQFEVQQLTQSGSAPPPHPPQTYFLPDRSGPGLPVFLYERVKVRCYMDRAPKGWGSFPSSSP